MKVSLKKAKDCKVQMSVEVEADKVETRYQEVLQDFQRQARLPGFREGKAPVDMVEKRFAGEAREELLKSLIPEVYHQSVRAQKVSPVSLPKISGIQYSRGQKLSFSAEFEEAPAVSVKNYKGMKIKRESSEIGPDEIEKAMQALLDSRAEFTPVLEVRPAQQGDFVLCDIELWQDGRYTAGREGVLLSVEPSGEDDFFTKMVGASVNDQKEILKAGQPFSRVRLKEIQKKQAPELSDDFAKTLGRDTVEALREAVKKDLASYKQSQSFEKMKAELFEKLLSGTSFPVPESLVEKQKERLVEDTRKQYSRMGMSEQVWQGEAPKVELEAQKRAAEQIKLYFILQKISELEKIESDEIELESRLQAMAVQSKRPVEEVRQVFEEDLRESMREKKTVDFLIANAKFEEPERRPA